MQADGSLITNAKASVVRQITRWSIRNTIHSNLAQDAEESTLQTHKYHFYLKKKKFTTI